MFGDTPGQGERVKVHQPKRAVPDSTQDQTHETPAAAHGVQWGAAAAEGPDGAAEQPQLVSLVSFSKIRGGAGVSWVSKQELSFLPVHAEKKRFPQFLHN